MSDDTKRLEALEKENWYVPRETKFAMTPLGERLELFRKMYLATPIRQWRLAVRRRQAERRQTTTGQG
jgi:hypothetical protein